MKYDNKEILYTVRKYYEDNTPMDSIFEIVRYVVCFGTRGKQ